MLLFGRKRTENQKNLILSIDKEFESILKFCENLSKDERLKILFPLKQKLKFNFWKKIFLIKLILLTFGFLIYFLPFLNWNFSAIGRILMIKLLPIWNWKPWFNSRCLVNYLTIEDDTTKPPLSSGVKLYREDCVVCENYDNIAVISSTSFDYIHEKYLIRGNPIIIEDSHTTSRSQKNLTDYLLSIDKLIESTPCELQTNLMYGKNLNLEDILQIITRADKSEHWFLHFQNCDFDAVKVTRGIIDRPYFLSNHLDPFHTSWIIMSQNYLSDFKSLDVSGGLIVVMQFEGNSEFYLTARKPCDEICMEHVTTLYQGESLIFIADMWKLSYRPSAEGSAVNFITETDWNP